VKKDSSLKHDRFPKETRGGGRNGLRGGGGPDNVENRISNGQILLQIEWLNVFQEERGVIVGGGE